MERLRRVAPGVYETLDGEYRVERVDSFGEYDTTSSVWTITVRPQRADAEWAEIAEAPTKRACVELLPWHRARSKPSE